METQKEFEPSTTYVKGFNEGYAIAKYLPEAADTLSEILGNSERAIGFQQGRNEYIAEIEKTKDMDIYPDWLKEGYSINMDDIEKGKDKDELEPEID